MSQRYIDGLTVESSALWARMRPMRPADRVEFLRRYYESNGRESEALVGLFVRRMSDLFNGSCPRVSSPTADTIQRAGRQRIPGGTRFIMGGCAVDLLGDTVRWGVREDSHARSYAHETMLAKTLFRFLDQVRWTRGTGGTIIAEDEDCSRGYAVGAYGVHCQP